MRKRNGPQSQNELDMITAGLMTDPASKETPWDGVLPYTDQLKTDQQRELFARLYADYPSKHLINAGSLALFVQLVRLIIRADIIDDALSSEQTTAEFSRLLKIERELTMAISSTLSRLRASPASISNYRGNLLDKTPTVDGRANKPWNEGKPQEEWV